MLSLNRAEMAHIMAARKHQLASILSLFDRNAVIYYLDYPVHGNVGDLLINLGTEQFFSDHNLTIAGRFSVLDIDQLLREEIPDNSVILCHGGGNFGDLYPKHQKLRERVLDHFQRARVILMPQSLQFSSPAAEKSSLAYIARHRKCHILVRDFESLENLQAAGLQNVSVAPDMAHQLWGVLRPVAAARPGSAMVFLRRDQEATELPAELGDRPEIKPVDWSDLSTGAGRASAGAAYIALHLIANRRSAIKNATTWYAARDRLIQDAVKAFSPYARICTNRLHAMILALLLGRDVKAFDNSYGKLSRYIAAQLT